MFYIQKELFKQICNFIKKFLRTLKFRLCEK